MLALQCIAAIHADQSGSMIWRKRCRLRPDPEDLIRARRRADATVNGALDWIERFHSDADPDVVVRLIEGIRPLVRAMQGLLTGNGPQAIDQQTAKVRTILTNTPAYQQQVVEQVTVAVPANRRFMS
jgi:hypothetical protein